MYRHLNDDAVIKTGEDDAIGGGTTFVLGEATEILSNSYFNDEEVVEKWAKTGVECQVLVPNYGWQKGKVRISIEFAPEQES